MANYVDPDCQSIISWIGAATNATLIYLFRPSTTLRHQTPNPDLPQHGSVYLHQIVSQYDLSPTFQTILPTLIPLAAIALAASHGFIILRWIIEGLAERLLWRGSPEEAEVQRLTANVNAGQSKKIAELGKRKYDLESLRKGFWNGGNEGAAAIGSIGKSE